MSRDYNFGRYYYSVTKLSKFPIDVNSIFANIDKMIVKTFQLTPVQGRRNLGSRAMEKKSVNIIERKQNFYIG